MGVVLVFSDNKTHLLLRGVLGVLHPQRFRFERLVFDPEELACKGTHWTGSLFRTTGLVGVTSTPSRTSALIPTA
eukprot:457916-Pyramimonas_sp.AAC.1